MLTPTLCVDTYNGRRKGTTESINEERISIGYRDTGSALVGELIESGKSTENISLFC